MVSVLSEITMESEISILNSWSLQIWPEYLLLLKDSCRRGVRDRCVG